MGRLFFPERSPEGAPGTGSAGPIRRAASPPTRRTRAPNGDRSGKKKNRSARKAPRHHKTPSRRHSLIGMGLTCGACLWSPLVCSGELWIGLEVTSGAGIIGLCAVLSAMSRPSLVFRGAGQCARGRNPLVHSSKRDRLRPSGLAHPLAIARPWRRVESGLEVPGSAGIPGVADERGQEVPRGPNDLRLIGFKSAGPRPPRSAPVAVPRRRRPLSAESLPPRKKR
jgi:hypothetical protein